MASGLLENLFAVENDRVTLPVPQNEHDLFHVVADLSGALDAYCFIVDCQPIRLGVFGGDP